jgi:pimeloyl-ACP methyl ester carboxylesterase
MIGHPERNSPKAALLAADLRGWGETAMTPHPYESVSWGAPDRFAAYVGAALGDSPVAMRIRDAWRLARAFPLRARNVLSACGAAGPVALHLAALWPGRFAAVVLRDAPASYEALLATDDFAWPHDIILPGVLQHYDLPQLALRRRLSRALAQSARRRAPAGRSRCPSCAHQHRRQRTHRPRAPAALWLNPALIFHRRSQQAQRFRTSALSAASCKSGSGQPARHHADFDCGLHGGGVLSVDFRVIRGKTSVHTCRRICWR